MDRAPQRTNVHVAIRDSPSTQAESPGSPQAGSAESRMQRTRHQTPQPGTNAGKAERGRGTMGADDRSGASLHLRHGRTKPTRGLGWCFNLMLVILLICYSYFSYDADANANAHAHANVIKQMTSIKLLRRSRTTRHAR